MTTVDKLNTKKRDAAGKEVNIIKKSCDVTSPPPPIFRKLVELDIQSETSGFPGNVVEG